MGEYASTAKFSEFVVEVETTEGSGIYSRMCGITTRGVNRTSNMNTTAVPPCDDEDAPSRLERAVENQEQAISGTGVYARQSRDFMLKWWRSGQTKNVRIFHANAAPGEIEYERGPAYLTQLNNEANRGQKVTADITIEFDGVPEIDLADSGSSGT